MIKRLIVGIVVLLMWVGVAASTFAATSGPTRRPNIVILLADDLGFSDVGCYGGEIFTPAIDQLASEGVRFTQFYNMARCCPTRASLLTGLYPHQTGIGAMNQDLGKPAYRGELNDRCVTMAEMLKGAGYHTGMVGKWHLCHVNIATAPPEKQKAMLSFKDTGTPISPSTRNWPCNRGFEEHWGTIPGVESYFAPYGLVHNEEALGWTGPVMYYTDFIRDHAVELIDRYTAEPEPFFLYVAFTAPHWPLQVDEMEARSYAGTYDKGWDQIREERYARQLKMGLIKPDWPLSPLRVQSGAQRRCECRRPRADAPDKAWQARRMAVYAGMVQRMDHAITMILDKLHTTGAEKNTLVIFLSDNGGCQENVKPNWYDIPNETPTGEKIHVGNDPRVSPGPETSYQSYGPAWANASNTPFRKFKHFTEEGGISTPFIVRWPAGNLQGGRIERDAVGDVIDLMPTIAEASGAKYPETAPPMEGQSLLPVLKGSAAASTRTLFWEHEGNRAARIGDWKLVGPRGEGWKLFNLVADRTEMNDLSAQNPEKITELRSAYEAWAKRVGVENWPIEKSK